MNKDNIKKVFIRSLIFLTIDFIIKMIVTNNMNVNDTISVISGFFNITYLQNTGGGFSVFTGHPILLAFIGIIVVDLIYYYLEKIKIDKYETWLYAVLTGGIIGNMFDRILYGNVIDYLSFNIFGYAFPVFNFADICITVSITLIIISILKGEIKNGNKNSRRTRKN